LHSEDVVSYVDEVYYVICGRATSRFFSIQNTSGTYCMFVSHWPRFLLQNKESTHQATLWFLAIWYIVRPCMPIKAHNNLGGSLSVLSWYTNTNLKYIGT